MRKNILLLGMLIALGLSGCGDKGTKMLSSTDVTEENSNLPDGENQEETVSSEPVDDKSVDLADYSSYLKKIWIVEGWNDGADYPASLVITQIEKGYIKGYFCIDGFITFYYWNRALWKDRTPEFAGAIYDGTAECEYDYKNGRIGTFSITFCENDRIEVQLDGNEEQSHLLRPYNISDVEFLGEPMTMEVELDSWGTVTLFYAILDARHPCPLVFLLNEQGNIIYEFFGGFHNGSEVLDIVIEDFNGDNLKDVEVVTSFSADSDAYRFEWYFYQLENGLFYRDWLCGMERLEDGGVQLSLSFDKSSESWYYDGYFPKEPSVRQVGKKLLAVSVSVGSPACYTFYIDKEDARESDTYFNPILVGENYVAYMEDGELILSDIFYSVQQEDLLYMTIVRDFTKTADPMSAIIDIELIDSGNVKLTYLTGNDYTEVTEIISFEKDIKPEQSATVDSSSELIVSNPYFYDREEVFLQAKAKYFDGRFQGSRAEKAAYIDVEMLQTYENGSVYKFTVDIDEDEVYFDEGWLNYCFYVTEDRIYEVPSSISIPSEGLVFHFNEDISSLPEMFDTDEKLVEWSTIVCQEDEMIEDQESYYQRITKTGNQITYYSNSLKTNGDVYRSLYYTWEEGRGLISCGFRDGVGEGYDFTLYDIEELTVAGE